MVHVQTCLCHTVNGWLLSAANLGLFIIHFHTAVFFGFGGGASFTELIVRQRWSVNSIFSRLQPDKLVVCHEEPEDQQWFLWLFVIIDVLMCLDQLSTGTLSET